MKRIIYLWLITLIIGGCASTEKTRIGIQDYTGFTELRFPSNSYAPGQIVEIYPSSEKVEITHQPKIPWDKESVSPGWDISSIVATKTEMRLAVEITKIAKAKYSYVTDKNIKIRLTDTKTRLIPKSVIYSTLKKDLQNNADLKTQLTDYIKNGIPFNVITMILSARISFEIIDNSNNQVEVDSEIIKQINSELGLKFDKVNETNKFITGDDLVIGIHYDPSMINIILSSKS